MCVRFCYCFPRIEIRLTKNKFKSFVLFLLDDHPISSKLSTISLELGSNKHLHTPNSQRMLSGQYSTSTIRSDRFPLYRRN